MHLMEKRRVEKVNGRITGVLFFCSVAVCLWSFSGCAAVYDGEKLFFGAGCSQCHSFHGRGGRMGPDLSAVSNTRSDAWIDGYLQNPKKMNPLSRMPSFNHLSKSKRNAIISFLKK